MTSTFKSKIEITHIGTATAIMSINGINFLTDPFFSPIARQLLDSRRIFTTLDGAKNLAPRPAIHRLHPWETIKSTIGGKMFKITGVPYVHMPGDKYTGFILTNPDFSETNSLPNSIYFSGDTVYFEELVQMHEKFHISVALYNLGAAKVPVGPNGKMLQITICSAQAVRVFTETKADVLVPMHYISWKHFTEFVKNLRQAFKDAGVLKRIHWLKPGISKRII